MPALRALPPETAHGLALRAAALGLLPPARPDGPALVRVCRGGRPAAGGPRGAAGAWGAAGESQGPVGGVGGRPGARVACRGRRQAMSSASHARCSGRGSSAGAR